MHGSNRLGGNSLSDLLVFGKRAGDSAAAYVAGLSGRATLSDSDLAAAQELALSPFTTSGEGTDPSTGSGTENPYTIQHELQQTMNDLVGIIRTREELEKSLTEIEKFKERAQHLKVSGDRRYNPGWHLAIDLRNMLLVSECIAKAALEREESRGGHTRDDHPGFAEKWGTLNIALSINAAGDGVDLATQPLPVMPDDLAAFFEEGH
jgi:succinate dehydrogenase / fumarate reductase, flavoprotein subunit